MLEKLCSIIFMLQMLYRIWCSVTRLGDFLKFLSTKYLAKVAQMIGNFLGYFEKPHSDVKLHCILFG